MGSMYNEGREKQSNFTCTCIPVHSCGISASCEYSIRTALCSVLQHPVTTAPMGLTNQIAEQFEFCSLHDWLIQLTLC